MSGFHVAVAILAPLTLGLSLGALGMRAWYRRDMPTSFDLASVRRAHDALDAAKGTSRWWVG
jgi:hypothetical protein